MINFLKQIFTWWHRQTLGTFLYTLFTGKFVGSDQLGNKYYTNSKGKKWVIYKDLVESSKIPPEWHLWIHSERNNNQINNILVFSKKFRRQNMVIRGMTILGLQKKIILKKPLIYTTHL